MSQASLPVDRDDVASWRAELLQRFAWVICLGGAPLVLLILTASPPLVGVPLRPLQVVALCQLPLCYAVVALTPRRDLRWRGAALVLSALFLAGVGVRYWGPTPGVVFCSLLGAVLATVLFGRHAGAWTLAASAVGLLALGFAGSAETAPAWAATLTSFKTWVRLTFIYTLLAAALEMLVSGAMRRVENSLHQTRGALQEALREHEARTRTEAALQENEERLRLALDAAEMGTWDWDVSTGDIVWTARTEALLGVPAGAPATFETFRQTIHGQDRAGVEQSIEAALKGSGDEFQEEHRTRGEPSRWLRGRGRVYRDHDGRALRMRGTVEDVTVRKLAEERLRASEERWRRISEATFEGIGFSQDGVIVDMNPQLAEMLGYSVEELVGRPVLELVAPEDRDRVLAAMRGERQRAYEHRALRKDGTTVLVETRARALVQGDRRLRVTAVRDLSERMRLEVELRRRERLAAIGVLAGGVAHEVRTPLFGISATLDALDARWPGRDGDRDRDLKDLLRSQVTRLSDLMRDLLDYGRPPQMHLQPAVIAEVVDRVVERCAPLADGAAVRLGSGVEPDLPVLPVDAGRLEQVLENLITNAIQHSPRGATVTVSVARCELPGPGVQVSVADEGPGLPPGEIERVFEPFFSRRSGGTGLGLAIAQRYVEAHGGRLSAASRPTGGAEFTVFLPARSDGEARTA